MKNSILVFGLLIAFCACTQKQSSTTVGKTETLYRKVTSVESRAVSFENPKGLKGKGGMENKGAKGHAFERIKPGESKVLFDIQDMGVIRRFQMTIDDRTPQNLRSLIIEMYWDGASTPAVSVPLGDFFCVSHGKVARYENAFFSNPESKSFNCIIPMPFLKSAKILIKNETGHQINYIFYLIDYTREKLDAESTLYFHAAWQRDTKPKLGEDFVILPKVKGTGRLLGTNIGILTNPIYGTSWWGEGQVNYFLDGDTDFATIVGTGTEDYSGTSWGFGAFANMYQGCLISDWEKGIWSFYRLHVPDPVYFQKDLRITVERIGGNSQKEVIAMQNRGVPLIPVSIDAISGGPFVKLLDLPQPVDLKRGKFPDGWTNFYRNDDWCATTYFYLDRPENGLPPLADLNVRTENINFTNVVKRDDE